jgi:hypothetical protein
MNLFPEIVRLSNHTLSHIHSFQGRSFLARCLTSFLDPPSLRPQFRPEPIVSRCNHGTVEARREYTVQLNTLNVLAGPLPVVGQVDGVPGACGHPSVPRVHQLNAKLCSVIRPDDD